MAECKIMTSPATDTKLVSGTDVLALTIPRFYNDKDDVKHELSYPKAYLKFYKKSMKHIQNRKYCSDVKFRNIYNFKISQALETEYFHFSATYDY